jgi:hypothetical protein
MLTKLLKWFAFIAMTVRGDGTSNVMGICLYGFQLEKYFAMKQQSPEIFKVAPIGEMRTMLEMNIQTMMPLKDNHGRQIYIFRVGRWLYLKFF